MSKVYAPADKALKVLYDRAEAAFSQLATTAAWDELNVIREVSNVYEDINQTASEQYLMIARRAYHEAQKEIGVESSDDKNLALFLLLLLRKYDAKTQYRYDHEWERKRDRLAESILSLPKAEQVVNGNALRQALHRALNLMAGQLRNMADTVTDEARNEAFRDAGITEVVWNTQRDERVCEVCEERDRQVYPINALPPKHRRCRCYLTAKRI